MRILLVGSGNMAAACARAWKTANPDWTFLCYSPSGAKAQALALELKGESVASLENLPMVDAYVLGFKPQQLKQGVEPLKGKIPATSVVISLLAAVNIESLKNLCAHQNVIRLMPNMPLAFGGGVCLWAGEEATRWSASFANTAKSFVMSERELDFFTLHTGCAPAFLYYWMEKMVSFAKTHGHDPKLALSYLLHTFRGALKEEGLEGMDLTSKINQVTSKGGVTRAVLDVWETHPLLVEEGMAAGLAKVNEFVKLYSSEGTSN